MTALLALSAALIIGAVDFGGGLASRQVSPVRVTAWIYVAGFAVLLVLVWFVDAPLVTTTDSVAGVVIGTSGALSFVVFYFALTLGPISLLAPLTAIIGVIVPTIVGLTRGESLGPVQIGGIALALIAMALVAQDRASAGAEASATWAGIVLATIAGLGFSVFFLALAETSVEAGLWPLVIGRSVAVPMLIVLAFAVTGGLAIPAGAVRKIVAASGAAGVVSSILILWAYQRGPISLVAALGAFYPFSTVALARIVLDERLRRVQWIGVAFALAAMPMIAIK